MTAAQFSPVTCDSLSSMFRLITLALFAISICAQSAEEVHNDDLTRAARNPYNLARYIDSHTTIEWATLWTALRVSNPPVMPRCEPSFWSCSVDLITLFKPSQVILAVQTWPEDAYLRFLGEDSGWRYAGFHAAFKKNYAGRHEISRIDGKPFMRVSSQGASGSDWDSEYESWLDLSLPDLEPVFAFTVQGSEGRMGFGVSRWVHASATPGADASRETIDVDLEVRYSMYHELDLGFAKYKATYERAPKQKRFSLREAHPSLAGASAISNHDFEKLANIDVEGGPSNEQLLVYALPRLKEIASGSNVYAQKWLRSALSFCKDTPEKRTLQALLASKR